jgi:hypothetical protein
MRKIKQTTQTSQRKIADQRKFRSQNHRRASTSRLDIAILGSAITKTASFMHRAG